MSLNPRSFRSAVHTLYSQLFGIDRRSLAAGRMALAALVLIDLLQRSRHIFAFYSDGGVTPRAYLLTSLPAPFDVSLHMISGSWQFQALLFIVAGVFAGMLLLGYKTRVATIITWLLLLSLHNRNPFILQASDTLLRLGLFWGMFLPWGNTWSLDAVLKPEPPPKNNIVSVASLALLGQIAVLYLSSGIHKSSEVWWHQGLGVYLALNLDSFTTILGGWLRQFPTLLKFVSRSTYVLELYGPFFLFSPFFTHYIRLLMVVIYASFHVGIASSFKIGLFAWTDLALLIFFLPPHFWDTLAHGVKKISYLRLHIYFDSNCSVCGKIMQLIHTFILPYNLEKTPAADNPVAMKLMAAHNSWVVQDEKSNYHFAYDGVCTVIAASPFIWWLTPLLRRAWVTKLGERAYSWVANHRRLTCQPEITAPSAWLSLKGRHWSVIPQTIAAGFFIYIVAWNIATYPGATWKFPARLAWIASLTRVDQNWSMFTGDTSLHGWYVMPGYLRNGTEVDVLTTTSPVSWQKPKQVSNLYEDHHWHNLFQRLENDQLAHARGPYARYICREWNETRDASHQLIKFSMWFVLERTPLNPAAPAPLPEYRLQHEQPC